MKKSDRKKIQAFGNMVLEASFMDTAIKDK